MTDPKEKLPTIFGNRKQRRRLEKLIAKRARNEAKSPVHQTN